MEEEIGAYKRNGSCISWIIRIRCAREISETEESHQIKRLEDITHAQCILVYCSMKEPCMKGQEKLELPKRIQP